MGFNAARLIFLSSSIEPCQPSTTRSIRDSGKSEPLYLGAGYAEILEFLCAPVTGVANVKVLISAPGLGKTVLLRSAIERVKTEAQTAFVFWTLFHPKDFVEHLLIEMGSSEPPPADMNAAKDQFENLLRRAKADRKRIVVAIDEAHNLSPATLRILSSLLDRDIANPPQLTLLLAGQPSLNDQLADPDASGIRKRIAGVRTIAPLNAEQTAEYISARITALGISPVGPEQSAKIAASSGGVLRAIDNLCDELVPQDESWQQRIRDALRLDTPDEQQAGSPAEDTLLMEKPRDEIRLDKRGNEKPGNTLRLDPPRMPQPNPPVTDPLVAETRVAETRVIDARLSEGSNTTKRIAAWAADRPGMWSGTVGELASAIGISAEDISDAVENRTPELRRIGIAAAVQRAPGRPRMITLSKVKVEANIEVERQPAPESHPIIERVVAKPLPPAGLALPVERTASAPSLDPVRLQPKHEPREVETKAELRKDAPPCQQPGLHQESGLHQERALHQAPVNERSSVYHKPRFSQEPANESGLHWRKIFAKRKLRFGAAAKLETQARSSLESARDTGLDWARVLEQPSSGWALRAAVVLVVMGFGALVYLRYPDSPYKASTTELRVAETKPSTEADEVTGLLSDRRRLTLDAQAATKGDPAAQRRLGLALSLGSRAVPADRVAAYAWLVMARNAGQSVDKATLDSLARSFTPGEIRDVRYKLGRMYEYGIGCAPNLVSADEWLLLGAAVNDSRSRAESATLEGRMSPQQISQAHARAEDWLRRH